jgi:hypothetical protein
MYNSFGRYHDELLEELFAYLEETSNSAVLLPSDVTAIPGPR